MDEQDEKLRQLIAAVVQHSDGNQEWQRAMNRLLVFIQGLPEFAKYTRPECPDYSLDALNRTWQWLCRNLRNFQPRTLSIREDLVKWINGHFYWRLRELAKQNFQAELSLERLVGYQINEENDDTELNTTTWLERLSNERQIVSARFNATLTQGTEVLIEQLKNHSQQYLALNIELYIESDPEKRLRNCHPRQYPQCHCQLLSQRLYLKEPPERLANIAREYNINYQTLVWHWKNKGIPLLQTIAIELKYQLNQEL